MKKKTKKSTSASSTPDDLRTSVYELIRRSTIPLKINEISAAVGIASHSPQYEVLRAAIDTLIEEDRIRKTTRRRYVLASKADKSSFSGTLVLDYETSGYVETNDPEFPRIHIKRHDMLTGLHGDMVEVKLLALRPNKKPRGEVVNVVRRNMTPIAGTLEIDGDYIFFRPDEENYFLDFLVSKRNTAGAKSGDKVVARFLRWDNPHMNPEAEIIEVLGRAGVIRVEFDAIVKEFRLPTAFSPSVEAEALRSSKQEISAEGRTDLRAERVITIDPDDAKDFDDALSLRHLDNGNVELGVHIADVSSYVEEHSVLDREALDRANSYYLVDRVVPMLPEVLSNNVCSLVPHQDRRTFSVFMEFSSRGILKSHRVEETLIHSKRRFTYDEVQKIIDGKEDEFSDLIMDLQKLALTLRQRRFQQGGIDFETSEIRFVLDETKNPVRATLKRRTDATGLVEECMLAANQTVTEHIVKLSKAMKLKNTLPFMYRIHDDPDEEKLNAAMAFVRTLGVDVPTKNYSSRDINVLLQSLSERPESNVINQILLRSMAKAKYSGFNVGHYGLGFKNYTHFTSPIRRYPDVVVHRLLKEYAMQKPSDKRIAQLHEHLEEIAEHCSIQERFAVDAERASSKLAQVLMARQHIGDEMMGTITGVTGYGVFVLVDEIYAEGLLHIREMTGDYYYHDEPKYRLVGRRTKEVLGFGKRIRVQITKVQLDKRQIDLRLVREEDETTT